MQRCARFDSRLACLATTPASLSCSGNAEPFDTKTLAKRRLFLTGEHAPKSTRSRMIVDIPEWNRRHSNAKQINRRFDIVGDLLQSVQGSQRIDAYWNSTYQ